MAKKKVTVNLGGSSVLTAWNVEQNDGSFGLINIENWDNAATIRRNTASLLWDHGEVQSTNALFGAKHIEITILVDTGGYGSQLHVRQMLELALQDLNISRTVTVTEYALSGNEIKRETLRCRFEDEGFTWSQIGSAATVTLYLVAPNPIKTVYYNGSTTPATGGRI